MKLHHFSELEDSFTFLIQFLSLERKTERRAMVYLTSYFLYFVYAQPKMEMRCLYFVPPFTFFFSIFSVKLLFLESQLSNQISLK